MKNEKINCRLLEAMGDADDEEEEGDLLVRREKTKQEEVRSQAVTEPAK